MLLLMVLTVEDREAESQRFLYQTIDIRKFLLRETNYCSGNYVTYANRFFLLRSAEYNALEDRFSIPCSYSYILHNPRNHLYLGKYGEYAPRRYTKSLTFRSEASKVSRHSVETTNLTVAIFREYPHNFFHAMTQWYNVFVLSKILGFDPRTVTVLLLDKSPEVHIDTQWKQMYKRIIKAKDLRTNTQLGDVLFNIAGHESLMYYFSLRRLPYVKDFSDYFMNAFQVSNTKPFSCSNISVTLVLRHDYLMYPGDLSSKRNTERKFQNEAELVRTLHEEFRGHTVRTLVAEELSLQEQLEITSSTDVLIGMHGCVLTQILFLPAHAMVLEMYPIFWERKFFFSSLARWSNIKHDVWQNDVKENEFRENCSTYVSPAILKTYANRVRDHFHC